MNRIHVLFAASLFVAAAAFAGTTVQRARAFDPPTSEQFGLSGDYATRWNALREQTIALRETARSSTQQRLDMLHQLLSSNAPDLDSFSRDAQQQADNLLIQARALKAQKLALYDSLPAAQQAQVRAMLLNRVERLQHLRAALAELADASM